MPIGRLRIVVVLGCVVPLAEAALHSPPSAFEERAVYDVRVGPITVGSGTLTVSCDTSTSVPTRQIRVTVGAEPAFRRDERIEGHHAAYLDTIRRMPLAVGGARRDSVRVPAGAFDAVHLSPVIQGTTLFSQKGKTEIWVASDSTRAIVQMVSHRRFGSVTMRLRSFEVGRNCTTGG
jgi:hypothetical protein